MQTHTKIHAYQIDTTLKIANNNGIRMQRERERPACDCGTPSMVTEPLITVTILGNESQFVRRVIVLKCTQNDL